MGGASVRWNFDISQIAHLSAQARPVQAAAAAATEREAGAASGRPLHLPYVLPISEFRPLRRFTRVPRCGAHLPARTKSTIASNSSLMSVCDMRGVVWKTSSVELAPSTARMLFQ